MPEEDIGNNIQDELGSFQKDIDILAQEEDKPLFESAKDFYKDIKGIVGNKYNIYTNDNIKDSASYEELKNVVSERESRQFDVSNNSDLTAEQRAVEYNKINIYYSNKEGVLLNEAMKGDSTTDKYARFNKVNDSLYHGRDNFTKKEDVLARTNMDVDKDINAMDKVSTSGIVSNETVSFKLGLKKSLAEETSKLVVNQKELVAELTKNNADQKDIDRIKKKFDRAIELRRLINQYSLEAANDGVLTGDELTDYVTNKLGKNLTREAVETENTLFRDANAIQYKANLSDGNYFVGGLELIGSGLSNIAGVAKDSFIGDTISSVGALARLDFEDVYNDKGKFKRDFSDLQLQDKAGLSYIVNWTLDNLDDIVTEVVVAGIGGGVGVKAGKYTTSQILKATRLEKLLKGTVTGKRILNSKLTKGAEYLTNEGIMGLIGNPSLNIAAGDINSEERIVIDGIMDLALSPVFDGAMNFGGAQFSRITRGILNTKLAESFVVGEKKIIDQLIANGFELPDAEKFMGGLKNYLQQTGRNNSNRDILSFIRSNADKLKEEGSVINNGSVYTLREYTAKANNPFDLRVENHQEQLAIDKAIDLKDNTLESIDINNILGKVNQIHLYKTKEETIKKLLEISGNVTKKDIKAFIGNNKNSQLMQGIFNKISSVKDKISKINISSIITDTNSPLDEISELNEVLELLTEKLTRTSQMVTVYTPTTTKGGEVVFKNKLIKKDELSVEGYQIIYNQDDLKQPVFIDNTLKEKIRNNNFGNEQATINLITTGKVQKTAVESIEDLSSDLIKIFGDSDIKTDGSGLINIYEKDGYYILSLGKTKGDNTGLRSLIKDEDVEFTYRGKKIKLKTTEEELTTGRLNKILTEKLLNKTEPYAPGELKETLDIYTIRMAQELSVGKISNEFLARDVDSIVEIAVDNTNKLLKGTFNSKELTEFNLLIKDTVLTKHSILKLADISGLGAKERAHSLGTLVEGLMLQGAERFKTLEGKKILQSINASSLTIANKKEAITNLLLGKDAVNAFKYIGNNKVGNISKLDQKILGVKTTDPIFEVSKEQLDRFIKRLVDVKKSIGTTELVDLEIYEQLLKNQSESYIQTATAVYSDNLLHTALNDGNYNNKVLAIDVTTSKNIDTSAIDVLAVMVNDIADPEELISSVNKQILNVPKQLPKYDRDRLLNIIHQVNTIRDQAKGSTPVGFKQLVQVVDKFSKIIEDNFDTDGFKGGTFSYESQTSFGDNLLTKSFNYLLNPYQEAVIFNEDVANTINDYIQDNILTPGGYKGETLTAITKAAKDTDGDAAIYEKASSKINETIRKFIYPEADSFDLKGQGAVLANRNKVLKGLIESVGDKISKTDSIHILDAKGKLAKGIKKGNIVTSHLDEWAIMNTLQERLKKKHFDGIKIDFKDGTGPVAIKGIEEYRTMYKHLANAGGPTFDYRPIILEGNRISAFKKRGMPGTRENYRIANNFTEWLRTQKGSTGTTDKGVVSIKGNYINQLNDFIKVSGGDVGDSSKITELVKSNLTTDGGVKGFINLMNIGDKNSYGGYSKSYKKEAKDFTGFMQLNDGLFSDHIIKELNLTSMKLDNGQPDLVKIAKRISTLSAEQETLLPGSKITIRNYIIDEPKYVDIILMDKEKNKEKLTRDDIFTYKKDGKGKLILDNKGEKIIDGLDDNGKEYLLKTFQKELNGFKQNFQLKDFDIINKDEVKVFEAASIDLLTTAYSDGISFLHPKQIEFYSQFQSHIGKIKKTKVINGELVTYYEKSKSPIKMHHYGQNQDVSILFKTNFNSYTDDMLKQMDKLFGKDAINTRLIGAESEKLKNYGGKFMKATEDQYITINGVDHKIKGYIETDTSFDKHASTESEIHTETNGITKQGDTRTHPAASEFILRMKQELITEFLDKMKNTFGIDSKLDSTLFGDYENFARYVINKSGLKGDSLATSNQFLKDGLKKLKGVIETPKDPGLGFRAVMQPRIYRKDIKGNNIFINDDELVVSLERFKDMRNKMFEVDGEYYVTTYRNPVPNAENMTMNKVKIDYSMISMEDAGISSWNCFINKQADFDGDHLNIVYIDNKLYKGNQLGGMGITLGYILNSEELKGVNIDAVTNTIYNTDNALGLKEDIKDYIKDWIREQKGSLVQSRVPISQVEKGAVKTIAVTKNTVLDIDNKDKTLLLNVINDGSLNETETRDEMIKLLQDRNNLKTFLLEQIDIIEFNASGDLSLVSKAEKKLLLNDVKLIPGLQALHDKADGLLTREIKTITTEPNLKPTLTKANNNAITGKDNIDIVDSFIRTLDLVRKYGWEFNNAAALGKKPEKVKEEFKEGLLSSLKWDRDSLANLEKYGAIKNKKKIDKLKDTLKAKEEFIEEMVDNLGATTLDVEYKSLAGILEQMTLDLAHQGKEKMDEGWENILLESVFPGLDNDRVNKILSPISMSTGKTYTELGEKGVLKYGTEWSYADKDQIRIDLPLLDPHGKLYRRLEKEITYIRDNMSTISLTKADNLFFGFETGKDYWKEAEEALSEYSVPPGIQFLKENPTKATKEWTVPTDEQNKIGLQFYPGVGTKIMKNGGQTKFNKYIKDQGKKTITTITDLNAGYKELSSLNAADLLLRGKTKFNENPNIKYLSYNKYDGITTLPHEHKLDFINSVTKQLGIDGMGKNAILLRRNLTIDKDSLTPSQKVKLTFYHYMMKEPDLKNKDLTSMEVVNKIGENLPKIIKGIDPTLLPEASRKELQEVAKSLGVIVDRVEFNKTGYTVFKEKGGEDLPPYTIIDGQQYNVDTNGKNGEHILYKAIDKDLYKLNDDEAQAILDDIQVPAHKREFDLRKNLGIDTLTLQNTAQKADDFINDMGNYHSLITGTKAIRVFKDLMLRNQELKNNTPLDVYEGFINIQKTHNHVDKNRMRNIDNILFMRLYKGGSTPEAKKFNDLIKGFNETEIKYYNDLLDFVNGENSKKQNINDLFGKLNLNLDKLLSDGVDINEKLKGTSLIEDIVNLRHKTEKIAFYEDGIYNRKTFTNAYKYRANKNGVKYSNNDINSMYEAIFEYGIMQKGMYGKAIAGMRSSTFATTLGALSWFTGMAGFTMGIMQIPTELLRLASFSKHSLPSLNLNKVMNEHKILQSAGIEAGIHYGPIEIKPQFTHKLTYEVIRKLGKSIGMEDNSWFDEIIAKYGSALAANPLLITDLVADKGRKQVALGNTLKIFGFKSTEAFDAFITTASAKEAKELLNKVRLASEIKYHELSGGVTAGSYLWRETSFARNKYVMPFNYLMNWAYHLMSSTIGDSMQTIAGFKELLTGNKEKGIRLIKNSNLSERLLGQSLVAAGLYAKLNSHDTYDGEFNTQKDMWEFVKTLNGNLTANAMFMPFKAIGRGIEQEGGFISKLAATTSAVFNTAYREADLIGIVAEEGYNAYNVPGYNTREAIITALTVKGSKGLAFNKMIVTESMYPEFTKRATIDQIFGADNPNFDEEFYQNLYSDAKGLRIQGMWDSGNWGPILGEVASAMPIIRHISNLSDGGLSYDLYDKYVRSINKIVTSKSFDAYYNDPELMLIDGHFKGTNQNIWKYATGFATKFGTIDGNKEDTDYKKWVKTELSKYIPSHYEKFYTGTTENIAVGSLIQKMGIDGYIKSIRGDSKAQEYNHQLLLKLQADTPAKLPYVLSILLNSESYDELLNFKKAGYIIDTDGPEMQEVRTNLMIKYKDLIKGNIPLMAQLVSYQVMNDNPEFKDIMTSGSGLNSHIADRLATKMMITESYNKGSNQAMYIGTRFGTITNRLKDEFIDGNMSEAIYKTSLLDLYRKIDTEVQEGNFTPDQKLEIKTTLYKSLGKDAFILYEDPELGNSYESARINLAHKLYKHTSILEKYINDATIKGAKWDDANYGKTTSGSYKGAYRNTNLIRKYSAGGGSGNYGNGYLQGGANNIGNMLGNPRTNFKKIFQPAYKDYSNSSIPFGFRYTVNDERKAIEYFRAIMSPQYSKDIISRDTITPGQRVFQTSRRKAELTKQDYKNVGRQNFRGYLSKGLMRGLPGSKE